MTVSNHTSAYEPLISKFNNMHAHKLKKPEETKNWQPQRSPPNIIFYETMPEIRKAQNSSVFPSYYSGLEITQPYWWLQLKILPSDTSGYSNSS